MSNARTLTPDLRAVPDGKGWKGSIGATKLIEKDGAAAIESNDSEDEETQLAQNTHGNAGMGSGRVLVALAGSARLRRRARYRRIRRLAPLCA